VDQCVITRQITVAAGVFAPGHLGELTQIVPFEMVDPGAEGCRRAGRAGLLQDVLAVHLA
jgi:hypothetical protein